MLYMCGLTNTAPEKVINCKYPKGEARMVHGGGVGVRLFLDGARDCWCSSPCTRSRDGCVDAHRADIFLCGKNKYFLPQRGV